MLRALQWRVTCHRPLVTILPAGCFLLWLQPACQAHARHAAVCHAAARLLAAATLQPVIAKTVAKRKIAVFLSNRCFLHYHVVRPAAGFAGPEHRPLRSYRNHLRELFWLHREAGLAAKSFVPLFAPENDSLRTILSCRARVAGHFCACVHLQSQMPGGDRGLAVVSYRPVSGMRCCLAQPL